MISQLIRGNDKKKENVSSENVCLRSQKLGWTMFIKSPLPETCSMKIDHNNPAVFFFYVYYNLIIQEAEEHHLLLGTF